jgi:hypothetical protein
VESYKPQYYYFEAVECIRRLLLATVIGLVNADSAAAPTMGVLISLFFIYVFVKLEPFQAQDNVELSTILAFSITLAFEAALLIKVDATSDDPTDQLIFGVLMIVIVLIGPIMIFMKLVVFRLLKPSKKKKSSSIVTKAEPIKADDDNDEDLLKKKGGGGGGGDEAVLEMKVLKQIPSKSLLSNGGVGGGVGETKECDLEMMQRERSTNLSLDRPTTDVEGGSGEMQGGENASLQKDNPGLKI